ncbi:HAMP domain-containing sensor histidine kinase [Eggerthia catenaformis]|uniref:HAMP domain-containing sensor histidine kinase n=1 Tax=Eggerthia catenaformis TaxID=31973 RepID=UPI0028E214AF|nr:HAMP domain-containing sensor histidine kinase [Eggerthia catenaformis]
MLRRISLLKQLIVVFIILAIIDVAVLMPLIDYNLHSIIDSQMFDRLESAQLSYPSNDNEVSYIENKPKIGRVFTFEYNSKTNKTIITHLFGDSYTDIFNYLLARDIADIVADKSHRTIESKADILGKTYYYRILYKGKNNYYISFMSSDYSESLLAKMRNRIIYIVYGFMALTALVMIIWVMTLINPLRKIKIYIDHVKDRQKAVLSINRDDEIGLVANALTDMKENIDKQEKAKEEMIHNISHDLKTPIALIKSYSQSVKDDIYPYGDKNSSMDVILENADRLEHKVKTLLYLNRLDYIGSEELELKSFHMKDLIEHIVTQMNNLNSLDIQTVLEDVLFVGHQEHWRIAIENIIDNASRYAKKYIRITLKNNELIIYNDGESIEEDRIEDLFKPYVKGIKGQFGLGLSIAAKTADMYGYTIEARNEKTGVSFIFKKHSHQK